MDDKRKGMILGAFTADSLALSVHWVYNTRGIDKKVGRVTELMDPIVETFHPNKKAGDFTHYGDQMLLFLEHLHDNGQFDRQSYMERWVRFFDSYTGYKDHAMKDTRQNIRDGKQEFGSGSSDLAGAFYVPLLLGFQSETDKTLRSAVETAVRMTHNNDTVVKSALFFLEVLEKTVGGTAPRRGIEEVRNGGSYDADFIGLIEKGIESSGKDTRETIKNFGQACPADHGLPGVIHLIETYEEDLETGLIENIMAGGDSAARGIIAGAVLGAHKGTDAIPNRWQEGLKVKEKLKYFLEPK